MRQHSESLRESRRGRCHGQDSRPWRSVRGARHGRLRPPRRVSDSKTRFAAGRSHYRFDVPHSPRSGRGFLAPDEVRGCEQTPPLKPRTGRRSHRSSARNGLQHASFAPLGLCPSTREPRTPRTSSGARNRRPLCGLSTNPAAQVLGSDLAIALPLPQGNRIICFLPLFRGLAPTLRRDTKGLDGVESWIMRLPCASLAVAPGHESFSHRL